MPDEFDVPAYQRVEGSAQEPCPRGCGHTWHGEPCKLRGLPIGARWYPACECPGVFGVLTDRNDE